MKYSAWSFPPQWELNKQITPMGAGRFLPSRFLMLFFAKIANEMCFAIRHIYKNMSFSITFLEILTTPAITAFYFDFSEVREQKDKRR